MLNAEQIKLSLIKQINDLDSALLFILNTEKNRDTKLYVLPEFELGIEILRLENQDRLSLKFDELITEELQAKYHHSQKLSEVSSQFVCDKFTEEISITPKTIRWKIKSYTTKQTDYLFSFEEFKEEFFSCAVFSIQTGKLKCSNDVSYSLFESGNDKRLKTVKNKYVKAQITQKHLDLLEKVDWNGSFTPYQIQDFKQLIEKCMKHTGQDDDSWPARDIFRYLYNARKKLL